MNNAFEIQGNTLVKYSGEEAQILIPEGVEIIGERAFAENAKLVSVKLPDSVVHIKAHAFEKCVKLKTVEFSQKLEQIDYNAFYRCKKLEELVLPDTLRRLSSGAFAGCEKLRSVRCDSKVFEPEGDPFGGFNEKPIKGLLNPDGLLICLNTLFAYHGTATELVIPEGVTHIVGGVFRGGLMSWEKQSELEKVVLPSTVRYVGNVAFQNCTKLRTLEMPEGIQFGKNVFSGCTGLTDENGFFCHGGILLAYSGNSDVVHVPAGTKVIAEEIFAVSYGQNPGNKNIRQVILPEGLEVIGYGAFQNCDLLECIEIPQSVHTIGELAFASCDHLCRVSLKHQVAHMGDGVFSGCKGLADENGFAVLNHVLFGFYSGERTVVVPEGITEISTGCFRKMAIQAVTLPKSLKKLGAAFDSCELLEHIQIPEGVEVIPGGCFRGCTGLKTVILPASVKGIGRCAFEGCVALEQIELPAQLQVLKESAFEGCAALQTVSVPGGVRAIPYAVFKACTALASVELPEALEALGGQVFLGCTALRQIRLPATVKRIQYSAFSGCTALEKVHLESDDCEISASAFEGCEKLTDPDGFTVIGTTLWKYDGPGGEVTVPEGIRRLAPNVFREGSFWRGRCYERYRPEGSVTGINLPSTLERIGSYALAGCKALTQVRLPDSVVVIEAGAFFGSGVTEFCLPETIGQLSEKVLGECKALTRITLPRGLKQIGRKAFFGCSALSVIPIGAAVESIGESAFEQCTALTAFAVEEGSAHYGQLDGMLTNKAGDTILWCPGGKQLTDYAIADGIVTVADRAFVDCQTLKKIYIPQSVQNLGSCVFPRRAWNSPAGLKIIEAHPKAGLGMIGEDVFDLPEWGSEPYCHPKLPIHMVKEQVTQLLLGLGYCQNPEAYEGEYAQLYQQYVQSHEKSLMKKADALKLTVAAKYFAAKPGKTEKKAVNYKKLSDQAKVALLEQAVLANDLQQAKAVIAGCGSFEFTARALGLACLYSSLDMVKLLVENGATFQYTYNPTMKRKYGAAYGTKYNTYPVNYSKLIVKTQLNVYNPIAFAATQEFHFGELPDCSGTVNSQEQRGDIAQYLIRAETAGFDAATALSYGIVWGNQQLAQRLIRLGVRLSWHAVNGLTETEASVERNDFLLTLAELPVADCLQALETFAELLGEKKIILTQRVFESEQTPFLDAQVLRFVFARTDTTKLTKSKLMEMAIDREAVEAISVLADSGVFKTPAQRDKAISYAMKQSKTEAVAWLMDYKNRTADLAAEAAKEEEKAMRALMEDPNSVSALKKKWSYKKLEDGTLMITGYKGLEETVEVPAMIGKSKVTVIGEEAFCASEFTRSVNRQTRERIRSIVLPEGITQIGQRAFMLCASLEKLVLPGTVKTIGPGAFSRCPKLRDDKGFVIINDVLLDYVDPEGKYEAVILPEGVRQVADKALCADWPKDHFKKTKKLVLPESLERIGEGAFEGWEKLTELTVPAGVKTIGVRAFYRSGLVKLTLSEGIVHICKEAFAKTQLSQLQLPESLESIGPRALYGCSKLRDLYISDRLTTIGQELLGNYGDDGKPSWDSFYPSGIYVYTPAGSQAELHMKNYPGVYVKNDYPGKK